MHWIGLVEQPVADGMEVTTQKSWRLRANALHVVLAKEVSDLSSLFSILSAVGKAVQVDGDARSCAKGQAVALPEHGVASVLSGSILQQVGVGVGMA